VGSEAVKWVGVPKKGKTCFVKSQC